MFNEKKENPNPVGERNIIAKNSSLVGDIKSDGDFRVDGKIEGTIQTTWSCGNRKRRYRIRHH